MDIPFRFSPHGFISCDRLFEPRGDQYAVFMLKQVTGRRGGAVTYAVVQVEVEMTGNVVDDGIVGMRHARKRRGEIDALVIDYHRPWRPGPGPEGFFMTAVSAEVSGSTSA